MGDSRDLCPHLDSIGEVTKEDLLLKSKVKVRPHRAEVTAILGCIRMCLKQWENWLPYRVCLAICANGEAGVCLGGLPEAGS